MDTDITKMIDSELERENIDDVTDDFDGELVLDLPQDAHLIEEWGLEESIDPEVNMTLDKDTNELLKREE